MCFVNGDKENKITVDIKWKEGSECEEKQNAVWLLRYKLKN